MNINEELMSEEVLHTVEGKLTNRGVRIYEKDAILELENRGYGEKTETTLKLKNYEAAYLMQIGKLEVKKNNKKVDFGEFISQSLKKYTKSWTSFLIYRDLRSRGYILRDGFGFGVDFRIYNRGEFGIKPAKYVIFGLNEGSRLTAKRLKEHIQQITKMGKEPIIAVIERRGEIIYYKASKAQFKEAK